MFLQVPVKLDFDQRVTIDSNKTLEGVYERETHFGLCMILNFASMHDV